MDAAMHPKGVEALAAVVRELESDPKVREEVENRIADFMRVHEADSGAWFEELAYCLLTAYSSAEVGQRSVEALSSHDTLLGGSLEEVRLCLVRQGHRFADRRAEYIVEARRLAPSIKSTVQSFSDPKEARRWLVENVKGLGWKEASHFLRNVGYLDLAILDRHILSNMREHGLVEDDGKKALTRKRYLEYEKILERVAERVGMPVGEMDLYLWYRKTGKVLK